MSTPTFRHGQFVWRDLMTPDVQAAKAFYGGLFGWTFREPKEGSMPYWEFSSDGTPIGGIMQSDPNGPPMAFWSSYVSVADVDATFARAVEGGAQPFVPPTSVEDGKIRFAVLADPAGAVFSLLHMTTGDSPSVPLRPEGQFCWESLNTADVGAATTFYARVFGWTFQESPMPVFLAGTEMIADVSPPPPGVPSHWMTHVVVASASGSAKKAASLGGKVLMDDMEIPGYGRMSVVQDPSGGVIGLFQSARAG